MLHRIFIAVNVPDKAKQELLSLREKWPELPARWTKPENLHITLVFLGNTSDKELEEVKRITREVALKHSPFPFSFSKVVYGPSEKQARMIWVKGESQELSKFQKELEKTLSSSKVLHYVPEKKPWSLHLTLARLREWEFQTIDLEERPDVQEELSMDIPVNSIEIMESRLKRGGAEYYVVESIPLKT